MIGQGGPRTSLEQRAATARIAAAGRCCWSALWVLAVLLPRVLPAADETMRLRIAWGGGSERTWQGTVALSKGTLADPQALGIEADEPGSMWLEDDRQQGQRLAIRQRSSRSYDGLDLLLTAPLDATLNVQLTAVDDPQHPASFQFPLSNLVGELQNKELDSQGNRLLVHRAPGDLLRVSFPRSSLVFAPGEALKLTVEPNLLPLAAGSRVQIKVQLFPARSQRELWSAQYNIQLGQSASIPLEVPFGTDEGAYDVVISAVYASNWQQAVRQPLNWKKTVAERSMQCLVLGPNRPASAAKAEPELTPLVTIDPANPRWWELLSKLPQLPKLPRLWKGSLGNGNMQVWKHPLGDIVRLNPSADSPDLSWEAYTLPISQPGRPHILEVEYPSDFPQTLGISILEPNAAGALMPIGLDSGIDLAAEVIGNRAPRWLRHRLIFWPRTTHPLVLMTNRRDRSPAAYGKIRVLGGWEHLPGALPAEPRQGQRMLAAYFDRPLFPENFAASQSLDNWSGHSLDDWVTFYEGGTRLIEYLNHVGYNGLMLSVMADGSTIYPSALVAPTPRYDKGVLFATGQDPVRKDVLEMLFRLCDREHLQLTPAVDFSAPLPDLEAIIRRGGAEAEALQWIGPEGSPLPQVDRPRRGMAPYYNVLNPQVQEAMRAVAREVVRRYGHHASFGGLALQLSARGYAQLPGPDWGLDDATIARFEQDTAIKVPGTGTGRFAQRAEFLAGQNRLAWLQWRADALSRFHRQLQAEVTAVRPDGRLYLAGANMFAGDEWEYQLRPALTRKTSLAEALLRAGIDTQHYQSEQGPVLLRPERIVPSGAPAALALSLELGQMPDADRCFQNVATPGSLFFHAPQEARVESFDAKSPFKPTYTWLVTEAVPADCQNRRRFVHSLATLDAQVLVDGGWLLALGQEDSLRSLVAAYRRLPAVRFERVLEGHGTTPSQPVTFRCATHAGRTYVYAVNDAPFRVTAQVRVEAPEGCRLQELTGLRQVAPLQREADRTYWTVELEPYDLVAVYLSEPGAQLSQVQVSLPDSVEPALQQRIWQLGGRTAALRTPPPLRTLANADFERTASGDDQLPDWAVTKRSGVSIQPDKTQAHGGSQAARIASNGPVACLVSRPFPAPATGRLSMAVWLRIADAAPQPSLRLALEGKLNGQPYYRYAEVGSPLGGGQPAVPIAATWTQYIFAVDDLPLEGLSQLRARFDLMGAGEVWVDDVQLFDLAFSEKERHELAKLITLAEYQLRNRQTGDCLRLLEGYWPRFLEDHVPLEPTSGPLAQQPGRTESSAGNPPSPPPPRTGLKERVKNLLPEHLRF